MIEQERLKVIGQAIQAGIDEATIENFLKNDNINDSYIENIKIRMGIKVPKPVRVKKPIKSQSSNTSNSSNQNSAEKSQ